MEFEKGLTFIETNDHYWQVGKLTFIRSALKKASNGRVFIDVRRYTEIYNPLNPDDHQKIPSTKGVMIELDLFRDEILPELIELCKYNGNGEKSND